MFKVLYMALLFACIAIVASISSGGATLFIAGSTTVYCNKVSYMEGKNTYYSECSDNNDYYLMIKEPQK